MLFFTSKHHLLTRQEDKAYSFAREALDRGSYKLHTSMTRKDGNSTLLLRTIKFCLGKPEEGVNNEVCFFVLESKNAKMLCDI